MHGVILPQVQDLSLSLVELHEVSVCPFLKPIEVPLNGSITCYISILVFYVEEKLLLKSNPHVTVFGFGFGLHDQIGLFSEFGCI